MTDPTSKQGVVLGIDLGTSRTSITSSNGVRETVWSYVGYPKDHVAKKKFGGRDVIFGKEAVENRLALNLISSSHRISSSHTSVSHRTNRPT